MSRALATIALLILSNTFMTLAWYGHIAFKSKIERFGMLSIILLHNGIPLELSSYLENIICNRFKVRCHNIFIVTFHGLKIGWICIVWSIGTATSRQENSLASWQG